MRLRALASEPGNFFRSLAEEEGRPSEAWQAMVTWPDGVIFGLFDGDTLVGITAAYTDSNDSSGQTAGLGMTWIDPEWRGRGLAARFYQVRLDWARERGYARAAVSHRDGNEPSRRAMLAQGFREIERAPIRWPDGAVVDDVRYELVLR